VQGLIPRPPNELMLLTGEATESGGCAADLKMIARGLAPALCVIQEPV
jgi:hypothetical protein